MHVHQNQLDPNLQLSYMSSIAKTEAKKEAERTRRKLLEAASSLANAYADEEGYVVRLGSHEGAHEDSSQNHGHPRQQKQNSAQTAQELFSDYA
jgi:hypothetical protein